jgi:hypothetical protein
VKEEEGEAERRLLFTGLFSGEGPLHGRDDVVELGEGGLLERDGVWHGDVSTGHSLHRSVQVVEGVAFHDGGGDLGSYSALGIALLESDEAVGLLYRIDDRVSIKGADCSEGVSEEEEGTEGRT